jgi:hypothetical protein
MKELVYSVKVGTRDALLGSHFGCSRPHQEESAEAARTTRAIRNRAAACVADGGGIFENQL